MQVVCFDFDGVICDSAPETAFTAWTCCRELWPEGPEFGPDLQERFGRLRPVLLTGYEAIPLMRLLETDAVPEAALFADFPAQRDAFMRGEGLAAEDLKARFGRTRDGLIARDREGWLRWNRFYPGIPELLVEALARHTVYIVTTKQERFVTLLLEHHGLSLDPARILGLERGLSKPELLLQLTAEPSAADHTFHFIEDRVETLHDVLATRKLDDVRLYLADWGYNTPEQREEAAFDPHIRVVDVPGFRRALGLPAA